MTILEIILLVALLLMIALYLTSKLRKGKSFNEIIKEVKSDLIQTSSNVSELVTKAKEIIFDETIQKTIKEFIMIVEEKNSLAKGNGETYLTGDEKKKAVVSRLSEWVSNLTGSVDNAVSFIENNQKKIESIIDEHISFSNKMEGKASLSEAEKIIEEQLYR